MSNSVAQSFAMSVVTILGASATTAFAQSAPVAAPPYTLAPFATAPTGLSAPDSIAVVGNNVFVGYGDGHAPDGSDGLSSQIVEFAMDGTVIHTFTVPGHNDGLKLDPVTHQLWALQNEDAHPNLVIIDPKSGHQSSAFPFSAEPHGGGYDDIVFRGCKVYISASNPSGNPNTGPAIVSAHLQGGVVTVSPLLMGNAKAIDVPTGATVTLNLQDPDSMTLDPQGNIVLDSQADQELIYVTHPGQPNQQALRLPLSFQTAGVSTPVETDDTNFVTSEDGFILFADKGLNTVYKLSRPGFVPGTAFTAADGGPFVGTLDISSGVITPIVTGLMSPGGLVFVKHSVNSSAYGGDTVQQSGPLNEAKECDRDE
ncbi:MAG TPA: hypothetical protein VK727_04250 [Steroidobacteraceae bacterium]|nr:hypothetical protein [Steroidobacteraceae bacterium]